MRRRYERCRMVVENSLRLGALEVEGASVDSQRGLLEQSLQTLAEAI
jgi:hypothetical protein